MLLPLVVLAAKPTTTDKLIISKPITLSDKIEQLADNYSVSSITMKKVISCESDYDTQAVGDHGHSFGLVQINLPSHPEITKEQALNEDFAIDYLAKNLASGKGRMWSCYRHLNIPV